MRDILTLSYVAEWLQKHRVIPKKRRRREAFGTDLARAGAWLQGEARRVQGLEAFHASSHAHEKKLQAFQASQQLYESLIEHARELYPEVFQAMEQRYGRLFAPYKALMALLEDCSPKSASPESEDVFAEDALVASLDAVPESPESSAFEWVNGYRFYRNQ